MKPCVFLLLAALSAVSCAPSLKRIGYREAAPSSAGLDIQMMRNAPVPDSLARLGTLVLYDNGFSFGGSEDRALNLIRLEGDALRARSVNLYNIQPPSIWSSCFQTYADFYADTISREVALAATLPYGSRIDSTVARGLSLALVSQMGIVTGGRQNDLGLQPRPSVSKFGLGVRVTDMLTESYGIDAGYDFIFSSANAKGYQSLDLFDEHVLRLGARYALYRKYKPFSLIHIDAQAGLNYDLLKMAGEFNNLLVAGTGGLYQPSTERATGVGWYAGGIFQVHSKSNVLYGFGVEYSEMNPKFKQAAEAIDVKTVCFSFVLGYRF